MELPPVPPGPRLLLAPSFRLGLGPEAEVTSSEELLLATPGLACPSGRGSGTPGLAQALLLPCRTVHCRRSGQAWQGRAQAKLSNPHYVSPSQPVAQECRLWAWQGRAGQGCVWARITGACTTRAAGVGCYLFLGVRTGSVAPNKRAPLCSLSAVSLYSKARVQQAPARRVVLLSRQRSDAHFRVARHSNAAKTAH